MPPIGIPAVFNTDYTFHSNLGYLSYHRASHYAIVDSSSYGIWFAPDDKMIPPGQPVVTGFPLFVGADIPLITQRFLYWPGSGDAYWSDVTTYDYEIQVFTDLKQTQGDPVNIGDSIYFYFPKHSGYLIQDPNNPEYLTVGDASAALAWTIAVD
ncbi:MAG TPA: hypothetical protein VF824_11920 [Thermoanaerobaculia bacterium]|jgi:hypothetical protein